MKACSYCGKEYHDEAVVCPTDGQPLGERTESPQKSGGHFAVCPVCGASDGYTPTVELRGSFSLPVFLAGGFLAVLFRNAGRSRKVRCNKCQAIFSIRSPLSKVSLAIFWILIALFVVAVIISLVELLHTFFSP